MKGRKLTILFSGMIAADPFQGGATWAVLQYVLGLGRLGHDVYFVEPVPPKSLLPPGAALPDSTNARYFASVVEEFALHGRAALLLAGTQETVGLSYEDLREVVRRTDLLINVSGILADASLLEPVPRRVYLDLDPGFVQLWHTQGIDMRFDGHTHFVTVGTQIGTPDCTVPTCGREWIGTAQPVVLRHWRLAPDTRHDALTTVANWRGYGSIEHEGVHYGQKAHSLRPMIDLPRRTRERFMLALSIHPGDECDVEALRRNGWNLVDPAEAAGTPASYAAFVAGSKAEFGIAKSGYVASRCAWFSDRSACYLASGRAVLAQETGWSNWLPPGEGLFSFQSADDVLSAIESLNRDYESHRRAARAIAERYFDSDVVLPRLLEAVGAA